MLTLTWLTLGFGLIDAIPNTSVSTRTELFSCTTQMSKTHALIFLHNSTIDQIPKGVNNIINMVDHPIEEFHGKLIFPVNKIHGRK